MDQDHRGRRKDGKPFKPGNTRNDGSYAVGKERPPASGQFAKDDGRARGRRSKGTKNLATDWAEELSERITISEGGKPKRVTKQRALVKSTIDRGLKRSDRAAETAFRHAAERAASTALSISDQEVMEAWIANRAVRSEGDPHSPVQPEAPGDQ